MPRVRLVIAYQGTRYHGWQLQPGKPTIQAALEDAFQRMTGFKASILAAGRTDAGVHAAGQVVCLENPSRHRPEALLAGLNALLPKDIVVLHAQEAPGDFDPRRQALGKHYRYTIYQSLVRPVFERDFCWQVRDRLDVSAMQQAGLVLVGEHDLGAFRASGSEAKSAVRRIDGIAWREMPPKLTMDIWGRGFLKQMVRNIVGTCVEVGRGRMKPIEISDVLESRDRRRAGPTAPASGLCLMKVYYDQGQYQSDLERGAWFRW